MLLTLDHWTNNDYQQFLKLLESYQDLKYQAFNKKLLNCDINVIGIRIPILKNFAKQISKGNYQEFINLNRHQTFEEIAIHGLIIGYIKTDINHCISLLNNFIPLINNWAVNDIVAANLTIFKKEQAIGFNKINEYLNSNNSWIIRFGLVLLLDYYLNDNYIDYVLKIVTSIKNEEYYVKMAIAWLISICYIKYPNKTIKLFENQLLDTWTNNKAIQKIRESLRVSKDDKEKLNKYRKQ